MEQASGHWQLGRGKVIYSILYWGTCADYEISYFKTQSAFGKLSANVSFLLQIENLEKFNRLIG